MHTSLTFSTQNALLKCQQRFLANLAQNVHGHCPLAQVQDKPVTMGMTLFESKIYLINGPGDLFFTCKTSKMKPHRFLQLHSQFNLLIIHDSCIFHLTTKTRPPFHRQALMTKDTNFRSKFTIIHLLEYNLSQGFLKNDMVQIWLTALSILIAFLLLLISGCTFFLWKCKKKIEDKSSGQYWVITAVTK